MQWNKPEGTSACWVCAEGYTITASRDPLSDKGRTKAYRYIVFFQGKILQWQRDGQAVTVTLDPAEAKAACASHHHASRSAVA